MLSRSVARAEDLNSRSDYHYRLAITVLVSDFYFEGPPCLHDEMAMGAPHFCLLRRRSDGCKRSVDGCIWMRLRVARKQQRKEQRGQDCK
jgi:hypothetical protein